MRSLSRIDNRNIDKIRKHNDDDDDDLNYELKLLFIS